MDVTKFKPVVDDLMRKFRISKDKRDDLSQECYVALLETKFPEDVRDENNYAATICRNRLIDIFRKQNITVTPQSLDDPRNYSKATKIEQPGGSGVTEHQLNEAVCDLPYEDYQVVHSLYYEGNTEEKTATDLGLTRKTIRYRKQRGIEQLKEHFEVE